MKLSEFDFDLPDELIATRPVRPRSTARLLVADGDRIADRHVFELPEILRPGDRLILNDTKVIPARLIGSRRRKGTEGETTARVECLLLEPTATGNWRAMLKPLKKVHDGEEIVFAGGLRAMVNGRDAEIATVTFNQEGPEFDAALAAAGEMPLPPYIAQRRAADARDREDYQTIWAKTAGAVAAPTASLHFDAPLLAALGRRGVAFTHITLHVGAGTFLPVKVDNVADHRMHAERGEISEQAAAEMRETKATGSRLIPVGTTALRLIETATQNGGIEPWTGKTDIFITPGFQFGATDALITNFHLPKSTLLMLVAALMGPSQIHRIYAHAIDARYRFFSYGDASILFPKR